MSFYAAVKGAKRAVCLEPEVDGSRNGMINGYNEIRSELPESLPVNLISLKLQDYLQQTGACIVRCSHDAQPPSTISMKKHASIYWKMTPATTGTWPFLKAYTGS